MQVIDEEIDMPREGYRGKIEINIPKIILGLDVEEQQG